MSVREVFDSLGSGTKFLGGNLTPVNSAKVAAGFAELSFFFALFFKMYDVDHFSDDMAKFTDSD